MRQNKKFAGFNAEAALRVAATTLQFLNKEGSCSSDELKEDFSSSDELKEGFFSSDELKDQIQITAFKALEAWDRFDPSKASFSTWISVIARNTFYNEARKFWKRNRVSFDLVENFGDYGQNPETLYIRGERGEAIMTVIESYQGTNRAILEGLADGKKPRHLAEELPLPVNSITIRSCRLRKEIAARLDGTPADDLLKEIA